MRGIRPASRQIPWSVISPPTGTDPNRGRLRDGFTDAHSPAFRRPGSVSLSVHPETLTAVAASSKLTPELRRQAEAMLRDTGAIPSSAT